MQEQVQLTECLTCGAMVDRMTKHRLWHEDIERKVRDLEAAQRRATRVPLPSMAPRAPSQLPR